MKIIFFGSSEFAVPVIEALREKEDVILTVTQPDKKKGRSLKLGATPVKEAASGLDIDVFQPINVNSKDSIQTLKKLGAEMFVVVSFGQILSGELLGIPKLYALNVHGSLLPKYRGAAPINRAIAAGEKETGITVIKMNEKMDEGDILLKESLTIGGDDAITLSKKLSKMGAEAILKSIDLIKNNRANFTKQDDLQATYAPKLKKEDGFVDWNMAADEICNRVRAFVPWPGCFTHWNGKILKIWKSDMLSEPARSKPGTISQVTKDAILVNTGNGVLVIRELQIESKRRMKIEEFIAGHKDLPGILT